VDKTL